MSDELLSNDRRASNYPDGASGCNHWGVIGVCAGVKQWWAGLQRLHKMGFKSTDKGEWIMCVLRGGGVMGGGGD